MSKHQLSLLKRVLKNVIRRGRPYLLARPALENAVLKGLNRYPRLKNKLRGLVSDSRSVTDGLVLMQLTGPLVVAQGDRLDEVLKDMSVGARQVYADLEMAIAGMSSGKGPKKKDAYAHRG